MDAIHKMEKTTTVIYKCPFCKTEIWFNYQHELALHFYREHLQEALNILAEQYKTKVKKTHEKWMIT